MRQRAGEWASEGDDGIKKRLLELLHTKFLHRDCYFKCMSGPNTTGDWFTQIASLCKCSPEAPSAKVDCTRKEWSSLPTPACSLNRSMCCFCLSFSSQLATWTLCCAVVAQRRERQRVRGREKPNATPLSISSIPLHGCSQFQQCHVQWPIPICLAVRLHRPGKNVHILEHQIRGLCLKSREIFLSQPILLELEAPLKICGTYIQTGRSRLCIIDWTGLVSSPPTCTRMTHFEFYVGQFGVTRISTLFWPSKNRKRRLSKSGGFCIFLGMSKWHSTITQLDDDDDADCEMYKFMYRCSW